MISEASTKNLISAPIPEISEVEETISRIRTLFQKEILLQQKKQEIDTAKKIATIGIQVAHDIRSPLSALEMISTHLEGLPEDIRTVIRGSIQRIRDIANTLSTNRAGSVALAAQSQALTQSPTPVFLVPILEQMISEKRVENRQHLSLSIEFEPDHLAYGLFAHVDSIELKRVISNILNNSIEAILLSRQKESSHLVSELQRVQVFLDSIPGLARIRIRDEGPGMTDEVQKNLGRPGFSVGKTNGTGLGLAHAFAQVKNWNGRIEICSQSGVGTEVTLLLPLAQAPTWFLPSLNLGPRETAVVIDDEPMIHQLFKNRLGASRVVSATRSDELEHVLRDFSGGVFLVDYEFNSAADWGRAQSGFDLIDRYHLAPQAVLVTSHFEDSKVIEECARRGMKLLPKPMARVVPV